MLNRVRASATRYKNRAKQIFSHIDMDTLELVNCGTLAWQAWRLAIVVSPVFSPLSSLPAVRGHSQNAAGQDLSSAVAAFWGTALHGHIAEAAWGLAFLTFLSIAALLEEKVWPRLLTMLTAVAWWAWEGFVFSLHTPHHDGGGAFFFFMLLAGGSAALLGRKIGKEAHLPALEKLLDWHQDRCQRKKYQKQVRSSTSGSPFAKAGP